MKLLGALETMEISGGFAKVLFQDTAFDITLTNSNDRIDILAFVLKGDGKVFFCGNYIDTTENSREVYSLDQYYTISTLKTSLGYHFKINLI